MSRPNFITNKEYLERFLLFDPAKEWGHDASHLFWHSINVKRTPEVLYEHWVDFFWDVYNRRTPNQELLSYLRKAMYPTNDTFLEDKENERFLC